jgi:hypothetical protein
MSIGFRSSMASKRRPLSQRMGRDPARLAVARGARFVIRGVSGRVAHGKSPCWFCTGRTRFAGVGNCVPDPLFGLGEMEGQQSISLCQDGQRAAPPPRARGRHAAPRDRICPPFSGGQILCPWKAVWLLGEARAFPGEPEGQCHRLPMCAKPFLAARGMGGSAAKGGQKNGRPGDGLPVIRSACRGHRTAYGAAHELGFTSAGLLFVDRLWDLGKGGPAALLPASLAGAAAFRNRFGRCQKKSARFPIRMPGARTCPRRLARAAALVLAGDGAVLVAAIVVAPATFLRGNAAARRRLRGPHPPAAPGGGGGRGAGRARAAPGEKIVDLAGLV